MAAVACLLFLAGCGGDREDTAGAEGDSRVPVDSRPQSEDPTSIPLPKYATASVRVYTTPPGFQVLVDGQLVLSEQGDPVVTPCAVQVSRGAHNFVVARAGYSDDGRLLTIEQDSEIELSPVEDSSDGQYSMLSAPWFRLPVGEPVSLDNVNSPGKELDPYVTADGLSMFFAGDRAGGRGIYVATRPSVWHPFDPPELIQMTRGPDVPATPSMTADALTVMYAIPEQARVWSVTRSGPLSPFDDRTAVRYSARTSSRWLSAQILPDAKRLYWVEQDQSAGGGAAGGKSELRGMAAVRREVASRFGENIEYPLPGLHPCLSRDGLRQYAFDGKVLSRARRASVTDRFSRLEVVASVELPGYVAATDRRQWWVLENEQWLFYCDDPHSEDPNLWAVRLFEQPAWGFRPTAKVIPPKPKVIASTTPETSPNDPAPIPPQKAVDPRTLPLPYVAFREEFQQLIAARNYSGAEERLQKMEASPAAEPVRELLKWDREDLTQLQLVLEDAARGAGSLKASETVRIGNARLSFVKFADGKLFAKAKTKDIVRPLNELDTSSLVDLAERVVQQSDPQAGLRLGTFLHYEPEGGERASLVWLERAGGAGTRFRQRLLDRQLQLARQEFDRNNRGAGLARLRKLMQDAPESAAAVTARELAENLYTQIEWDRRGSRKWGTPQPGTWVASQDRADGSVLVSPEKFENFELTLEWKAEGQTGQGGVFFRWSGNGSPADNAFKLQLANDADIPADRFTTGSLFQVEGPSRNAARPAGEWNTLRLQVMGTAVTAEINGQQVLKTTASDANIPLNGHVALDGGIGGISYRRVLLIDLPAASAGSSAAPAMKSE